MRQTLNEITENGVKYVAVDGGGNCTGCALYDVNEEYKCLQHSGSSYCGALREDGRSVIWIKKENQTETASENKVGFDMTKTKVGDKLLTHNGVVCEVVHIDHDCYYPYELRSCTNPDNHWTVDRFGYLICDELNPDGDIVGFADEQSRTSEVVPEPENKGVKSDQRKHNHYFKDVRHLDFIDVYRVIDLWELKDPALQHALKKLLVPGNRGHKDIQKDVQDVIDSCKRWQEMQAENGTKE